MQSWSKTTEQQIIFRFFGILTNDWIISNSIPGLYERPDFFPW